MHHLTARAARYVQLLVLSVLTVLTSTSAVDAQSYQIRAGDVLRIEVLEDPDLNRSVLVTPDGRITVPMAGTLRASGQPVEAIQRNLTNRLASAFANPPNVFVSVERIAERQPRLRQVVAPQLISVFVMGEANKPGQLEVSPGTNILQAFALMGGFTKFAATKRIQLRRTNFKGTAEAIISLNYKTIEQGAAGGRTVLREGDVIVVPQRRLFE